MTKNFIFQTMRAVIHGVYKSTNNHKAVALAYSCEQRYFLFKGNSEEAVCLKTPSWYCPLSVSGSCTMKSHGLYLRSLRWPWTRLHSLTRPLPSDAGSRPVRGRIQVKPYWAFPSSLYTQRNPAASGEHRSCLRRGQREEVMWSGLEAQAGCGWEQKGGLARYWSSGHHRPVSEGDIGGTADTRRHVKEKAQRRGKNARKPNLYTLFEFFRRLSLIHELNLYHLKITEPAF